MINLCDFGLFYSHVIIFDVSNLQVIIFLISFMVMRKQKQTSCDHVFIAFLALKVWVWKQEKIRKSNWHYLLISAVLSHSLFDSCGEIWSYCPGFHLHKICWFFELIMNHPSQTFYPPTFVHNWSTWVSHKDSCEVAG